MRSSLFKPLFWFGIVLIVLISGFIMLISPAFGILFLLLFVLGIVLALLFIPNLWDAVRPASRKKAEFHTSSKTRQPEMILESCSSDNENIVINKPVFVIGRASDSDYVYPNKSGIGYYHCRITYREATRQFFIEDLDSKFGTFLNSRRLNKKTPVPLQRNSTVSFHNHRYIFKSVN